MAAMPTTPPTMPPTMAPTLLDELSPLSLPRPDEGGGEKGEKVTDGLALTDAFPESLTLGGKNVNAFVHVPTAQ